MELLELFTIQGTLFLMILVGSLVKKLGIVDEAGRRCLTDLCINVIIPCNILKSCLIDIDSSVLRACGILLVGSEMCIRDSLRAACLWDFIGRGPGNPVCQCGAESSSL